MKRLFILAFAIMAVNVFSQTVVSSNRQWHNNCVVYLANPPSWYDEIIRFAPDTIIGTNTYMNVERSADNGVTWIPYGVIMEDASKKVYYNDELLYDFSVVAGDTLTVASVETSFGNVNVYHFQYKVLSVDSMLIGENYRKRINLATTEPLSDTIERWVDSIGSINAGMLHNSSMLVGRDTYTLSCYFEDEELKYGNGGCQFVTSVKDSEKNLTVSISPNPASGKAVLSFGTSTDKKAVSLISMTGAVILTTVTSETSVTIDLKNIPAGIYFVQATTENGVYTGKLIVK